MPFYRIEPEVSGGIGEKSVLNFSSAPAKVIKLNYNFDGWLGDALLESFPCFIITKLAATEIRKNNLSGVDFDEVLITTSELFDEMHPDRKLPAFSRLDIVGMAGADDFGIGADGVLVISEKALSVLNAFGLSHADIQPFRS